MAFLGYDYFMSMQNVAVFVNGKRHTRGVNVEWDDGEVRLINRSNFRTFETYKVEELAAEADDTMAWDIKDTRGDLVRLVVQTGCGCSGLIKKYQVRKDYSGAITRK